MAGVGFCLCCTTAQSWNSHSTFVVVFATGRLKFSDLNLLRTLRMKNRLPSDLMDQFKENFFLPDYQQKPSRSAGTLGAQLQGCRSFGEPLQVPFEDMHEKEGAASGQASARSSCSARLGGHHVPCNYYRAHSCWASSGGAQSLPFYERDRLTARQIHYCTSLVDMYAKCGSILDAQKMFDGLAQRDVVSWNALLGAYVSDGQAEKVLQLYNQMQLEGVSPNSRTFVSTLQACGMLAEKELDVVVDGQPTKMKALEKGKALHADARKKGYASDIFVANTLISMYGKCKSLSYAESVFGRLFKRDIVSWNALLVAHAQQGHAEEVVEVYERMLLDKVSPDVRTFLTALQACGTLAEKEVVIGGQGTKWKSLERGKKIHSDAWRKGLQSNAFVGNTLVSMYGKCGSIADAQYVFGELFERTVVSWTAMLMAYTSDGQAQRAMELYEWMLEECESPDVRVFVSCLQACGMLASEGCEAGHEGLTGLASLAKGKVMHAEVWKLGHRSDVYVGSALVSMYGKCGSIGDAQIVFDELSERDSAAWNAMVAAHVQQGQAYVAFLLYKEMLQEGVSPDFWTYVKILQACGILAEEAEDDVLVDGLFLRPTWLQKGKAMHAAAQRMGCVSDVFVGNTLVSMYGKCGSTVDAQHVFDGLTYFNVISWNSLLAAYTQQGKAEEAVQKYQLMLEDGMSRNDRTFVSMLQACGMLAEIEDRVPFGEFLVKAKSLSLGRAIHADAWRMGFTSDVFVGSTLVSMYGKCGSVADAEQVFEGLSERDVVRWNALLSAQAEQGSADRSLQLYGQMQEEGVKPNDVTFMCILQACSKTGSLDVCVKIRDAILANGITLTTSLASALIHAFGRCASMADAQNVFDTMVQHDVVSWTALIAGYAREGSWERSLQCYAAMQQAGVKPNGVTFLSLLSACTHGGLVNNGVEYFEAMSKEHGLAPEIEHYASMVDLLGRAGLFDRVEGLLSTMPMQPDLAVWLCLLGACRTHGKVRLGEEAFKHAVRLEPSHAAAYLLMANIYADAGRWDLALQLHGEREQAGASKNPGQSWVRHEEELHTFTVHDREHDQVERVYNILRTVDAELENAQIFSSDQGAP